jgi:hypothetical protein
MQICDICKKGESEFTIDWFTLGGTGIESYELCKSCYNFLLLLIGDMKAQPKSKGKPLQTHKRK